MGTITTHRAKGITNDEWFQREVLGEGCTILASSTIKGVYYAAVRNDDTGWVWALVIKTHRAPRSYHNFGWKSMDETMGPCYYDAPAKVLDLLSPTESEYANEWRARCRELAAKTLTAGQTIRVPQPLTFWVGVTKHKVSEFTYNPQGRRKAIFTACTEDGDRFLVSLPDWKSYSYELVQEVSA